MIITIAILGAILLLVVFVVAANLKATTFQERQQKFWKGIAVPLFTTFALGVLGIGFTVFYDKQKAIEYNNQRNAELPREVLASKDRQDSAFIKAVGKRLVLSLEHRREIMAAMNAGKGTDLARRTKLTTEQCYAERAAYFFHGMFHVALIEFYATKGHQLYQRHWMADAFVALADRVDNIVYGGRDQTSPEVPGDEEAALYAYFGHKHPALFDFNHMLYTLDKKNPGTPEEEALGKGCADFQERLASDSSGKVVRDLEMTVGAIIALDDYSFNKLFGVWYQGPDSPAEVQRLEEDEIPGKISQTPPCDYLFYPLRGWPKDVKAEDMRMNTWKIIYDAVDPKFRSVLRANQAEDCGARIALVPW
jgi:hypothetical protein